MDEILTNFIRQHTNANLWWYDIQPSVKSDEKSFGSFLNFHNDYEYEEFMLYMGFYKKHGTRITVYSENIMSFILMNKLLFISEYCVTYHHHVI